MPSLDLAKAAIDKVAATMRRQAGAQDVDLVARDMFTYPKDYGVWQGPNWEFDFLRSELCQRLWNTPVHPSEIPPAWRGLPYRTLRDLLVYKVLPVALFHNGIWLKGHAVDPPDEAVALEWLNAIACNRRHHGQEWKVWLNDPFTWQFRHVDPAALPRLRQMAYGT